jgi:hypothetical protein
MDRWIEREHLLIPEMIQIIRGTPVEKVLLGHSETLIKPLSMSGDKSKQYAEDLKPIKEAIII